MNEESSNSRKLPELNYILGLIVSILIGIVLYLFDLSIGRIQATLIIISLLSFYISGKIRSEFLIDFLEKFGIVNLFIALGVISLIFGGELNENFIRRY